jgi:hypothetical protein
MTKIRSILGVLLLSLPTLCWAQTTLTQGQYNTLQTDIGATPALATAVAAADWGAVVAYYNAVASPDYWVWRTAVPSSEYRKALVGSDIEALTVGKARSFEWLTGNLTLPIDASDPNVQASLGGVFGGGTTSRTNLLALVRAQATVVQKLFATGTGSTAAPATMGYVGPLRYADVAYAMPPHVPLP